MGFYRLSFFVLTQVIFVALITSSSNRDFLFAQTEQTKYSSNKSESHKFVLHVCGVEESFELGRLCQRCIFGEKFRFSRRCKRDFKKFNISFETTDETLGILRSKVKDVCSLSTPLWSYIQTSLLKDAIIFVMFATLVLNINFVKLLQSRVFSFLFDVFLWVAPKLLLLFAFVADKQYGYLFAFVANILSSFGFWFYSKGMSFANKMTGPFIQSLWVVLTRPLALGTFIWSTIMFESKVNGFVVSFGLFFTFTDLIGKKEFSDYMMSTLFVAFFMFEVCWFALKEQSSAFLKMRFGFFVCGIVLFVAYPFVQLLKRGRNAQSQALSLFCSFCVFLAGASMDSMNVAAIGGIFLYLSFFIFFIQEANEAGPKTMFVLLVCYSAIAYCSKNFIPELVKTALDFKNFL